MEVAVPRGVPKQGDMIAAARRGEGKPAAPFPAACAVGLRGEPAHGGKGRSSWAPCRGEYTIFQRA